jgi:hypothetical protein
VQLHQLVTWVQPYYLSSDTGQADVDTTLLKQSKVVFGGPFFLEAENYNGINDACGRVHRMLVAGTQGVYKVNWA